MRPILKVKLRSCIRENTYRYVFDPESFNSIWTLLENRYRQSKEFGSPDLRDIRGPTFLIRSAMKHHTITLICQSNTSTDEIDTFHYLIGYEDLAA